MLVRMWRKRNTPTLLVGLQDGTIALKSAWWYLRKFGMTLPEDPVIPRLGIYPVASPAYSKDTCSTLFIAALFIIGRSWKEPRFIQEKTRIQL